MIWSFLACFAETDKQAVPTEKAQRPDIVLVVVDTLRFDRLEIFGNSRTSLPTADRLAKEGLWFSRAYAQSGWTLPSFVSMWTGTYPHQHRVGRNPKDDKEFGSLPESTTTLAESLQEVGYATGAVINNTFLAPAFGLAQGFDDYLYQGADNTDLRSAEQTSKDALTWLEKQKKPSFMVVHYMEPHMHLDPKPAFRGVFAPKMEKPPVPIPFMTEHAFKMTQKDRTPVQMDYIFGLYDEEVWAVELGLRNLIDGIKKRGTWENTVFIITSDHGEEFWDHGKFEHGHSLMGILTHIPLIVYGPSFKGKGKVRTLVEHVDLYQGILSLAGAKSPEDTMGEDLFSLLQAEDAERWSISENTLYGGPQVSIMSPRHRLVL
ncbi:MAG: sulfatase, partial [Myxococcota bacterium]|nr:sulfatase [Myxococcota bacterium]